MPAREGECRRGPRSILGDCRVRACAGGGRRWAPAALVEMLRGWPLAELVAFHEVQEELLERDAYRWDLWAAAYVVNGGASEDGLRRPPRRPRTTRRHDRARKKLDRHANCIRAAFMASGIDRLTALPMNGADPRRLFAVPSGRDRRYGIDRVRRPVTALPEAGCHRGSR
ncbi:DUF4240 domain-containing protein [Virgisporangium ochraceum]|uniref:DUF4240 domain-containing protein n=1 Tax=Virgisporangium ochraceum TaxID=65505 RepID=UPI0035A25D4D